MRLLDGFFNRTIGVRERLGSLKSCGAGLHNKLSWQPKGKAPAYAGLPNLGIDQTTKRTNRSNFGDLIRRIFIFESRLC
jgi:hypothetical protein